MEKCTMEEAICEGEAYYSLSYSMEQNPS